MPNQRFTADAPAEDINELGNWLVQEHRPSHLYRGQTQHYSINVPSGYREGLLAEHEPEWRLLDRNYWRQASHRRQAQSDLMFSMLHFFGRGLGNILAQQYGVTSNAFDVTSAVEIAAFFATRRYPTYAHFTTTETESDLGVIYRFEVKARQPDLETMNTSLASLYMLIPETGQRVVFFEPHDVWALVLRKKVTDLKAFVEEKLPGERVKTELLRQAAYIPPETIRRALLEIATTAGVDEHYEAQYAHTRIARQQAGIYYPPVRHTGLIGARIDTQPMDAQGKHLRALPGVAVTLGAEAVFDLNANPFVDRFYFRHRAHCQVEIDTLDALWPSREHDLYFTILAEKAEKACQRYLVDYGIDVLHPTLGVLDRGYLADPG